MLIVRRDYLVVALMLERQGLSSLTGMIVVAIVVGKDFLLPIVIAQIGWLGSHLVGAIEDALPVGRSACTQTIITQTGRIIDISRGIKAVWLACHNEDDGLKL